MGINSSAEWREVFSADTEDINPLANWREVFRADWDEAFRPYLADLARCVEANKKTARAVRKAARISRQVLKQISGKCGETR